MAILRDTGATQSLNMLSCVGPVTSYCEVGVKTLIQGVDGVLFPCASLYG